MSHLNKKHKDFLLDKGGEDKVDDYYRENVAFDIEHGTDTADWLPKDEFKQHPANFSHGVLYRASPTSELIRAFGVIADKIDTSSAGFYDMGCGKGKTLLLAGMSQKFNEVVGVDYYQPFLNTAKSNLDICGVDDVKLHYADMSQYKDFKDTSVVFMYNPADAEIIDKVRQNLEECATKAIVIYNKPLHAELFKDWSILDHKGSDDPDHETVILGFGL